MDKEVAREVVRAAFRSGAELQKLLRLLKERCSPEDYKDYAKQVTMAIDDIDSALLDKVLAQFPELQDEIIAQQALAAHGHAVARGRLRHDVQERGRHLRVGFQNRRIGGIADAGHDLLHGLVSEVDVRHRHQAARIGEGRGRIIGGNGCGRDGLHRGADAAIGPRRLIDALRHKG